MKVDGVCTGRCLAQTSTIIMGYYMTRLDLNVGRYVYPGANTTMRDGGPLPLNISYGFPPFDQLDL